MIESRLFRDAGVVEVLPSGTLRAVDFQRAAAMAWRQETRGGAR